MKAVVFSKLSDNHKFSLFKEENDWYITPAGSGVYFKPEFPIGETIQPVLSIEFVPGVFADSDRIDNLLSSVITFMLDAKKELKVLYSPIETNYAVIQCDNCKNYTIVNLTGASSATMPCECPD